MTYATLQTQRTSTETSFKNRYASELVVKWRGASIWIPQRNDLLCNMRVILFFGMERVFSRSGCRWRVLHYKNNAWAHKHRSKTDMQANCSQTSDERAYRFPSGRASFAIRGSLRRFFWIGVSLLPNVCYITNKHNTCAHESLSKSNADSNWS